MSEKMSEEKQQICAKEVDVNQDGSFSYVCPICKNTYHQRDFIFLQEFGTQNILELCTDCMGDYEREHNTEINSDMLEKDQFNKIYEWAMFEVF
jgi:hypothetical protein